MRLIEIVADACHFDTLAVMLLRQRLLGRSEP
jgi:hypothetical protein